jgi:hypothetical protein
MPQRAVSLHVMTILACGSHERRERTDSSGAIFWKGTQVFMSKQKESKSLCLYVDNWLRASRHSLASRLHNSLRQADEMPLYARMLAIRL